MAHLNSDDISRHLYDVYLSTGMGPAQTAGSDAEAAFMRYLESTIIPEIPPERTSKILEVACGSGHLLGRLRELGYLHLEGVDRSHEQVAACRARGLDFVVRDDALHFLQDRATEFDCIVAMDLLEHLDLAQSLEFARSAKRALKPGGRIIVQTCNGASPVFGLIRYGDLTHRTAFTSSSVRQLFLAAGLNPIRVHGVIPSGRFPMGAMRRGAWQLLSGLVRLYLAVETGQWNHVVSRNLIAVAVKE